MLAGKKALLVHSSADLYGSDRCLTWIVDILCEQGMAVEVVLPYFGPLVDELRKTQVPVHIFDPIVFRRSLMTPASLMKLGAVAPVSVKDLHNLIKRRNFDIVHSNTGVVIGGALAAWRSGTPHIWHFREMLTEFKKLWKMHEPLAVRTSREIICISQAVAGQFVSQRAKSKISVVYDGIPVPAKKICAQGRALENRVIKLLTVGRLAHYKGQDVLISALRVMVDRGMSAEVTLVGDVFGDETDYRKELENQTAALGIQHLVHFEGFQHNVNQYLDRSDILVMPSRRPEGLGLVILEAMARCKPVVATDGGGVREIVIHGENGVLVEGDRPTALAEAIMKLADDRDLAQKIAENGFETVVSKFSLEKMNNGLVNVYRRVLG
ncbi:MAG: glycosyltransferase [Thermoleophilia bacterium]